MITKIQFTSLFLCLNIICCLTLNAQQESVEKILDLNGFIKPGSTGSYNVDGFKMNLDKNGAPIFEKLKSIKKTTTFTWNSVTGSGINGVNGTVNAIAINGSDVYVGGTFTSLGDGTTSAKNIAKWNGSSWSVLSIGGSNGVNNTVKAIAISGTDVYVGGYFTAFGDGTQVNRIAKWDGNNWSRLGNAGVDGLAHNVYAIAVSGIDVYVGGSFNLLGDNATSAKSIAKWNGTEWSVLTSGVSNGVNNTVFAIAVSGTNVYIGGNFVVLGDGTTSAKHIAKWDGSSWATLTSGGSNGVDNDVWTISVSGTDVYVGGSFTVLGDAVTVANHIAKWDGSSWSTLGSGATNGIGGLVTSTSINGTDLYAGGYFTFLGNGTSANYLAKWNGTNWSAVGNGSSDVINTLKVSTTEGTMYLGGAFTTLNSSVSANYIGTFTDSDNPLPVELTSFYAEAKTSTVDLKWTTATEVNNYGFEIERATASEGKLVKWEKIGIVNGAGNSNSPRDYSFRDVEPARAKSSYRLKMVDIDGTYEYSKVIEVNTHLPSKFSLSQNYPNPFNPNTTIRYQLPQNSFVTVKVFDVLGKEVEILVNEEKDAGNYEVNFDASKLASGIYLYKMQTENFTEIRKLLLLK